MWETWIWGLSRVPRGESLRAGNSSCAGGVGFRRRGVPAGESPFASAPRTVWGPVASGRRGGRDLEPARAVGPRPARGSAGESPFASERGDARRRGGSGLGLQPVLEPVPLPQVVVLQTERLKVREDEAVPRSRPRVHPREPGGPGEAPGRYSSPPRPRSGAALRCPSPARAASRPGPACLRRSDEEPRKSRPRRGLPCVGCQRRGGRRRRPATSPALWLCLCRRRPGRRSDPEQGRGGAGPEGRGGEGRVTPRAGSAPGPAAEKWTRRACAPTRRPCARPGPPPSTHRRGGPLSATLESAGSPTGGRRV